VMYYGCKNTSPLSLPMLDMDSLAKILSLLVVLLDNVTFPERT